MYVWVDVCECVSMSIAFPVGANNRNQLTGIECDARLTPESMAVNKLMTSNIDCILSPSLSLYVCVCVLGRP